MHAPLRVAVALSNMLAPFGGLSIAGLQWQCMNTEHCVDVQIISDSHEAIIVHNKRKSQSLGASLSSQFSQLVTSCAGLAIRIRPIACTQVPKARRYVLRAFARGFPRRRSGHVPPGASQSVVAGSRSLGESSQPASQLPPPNLGFFSQPSSAPVRRATDPRQQIPPIPSRISRLPRILSPIVLICVGLRVPRSIPFRCQSHRDASSFDEPLLSVLLDPRHVAPLFILVSRKLEAATVAPFFHRLRLGCRSSIQCIHPTTSNSASLLSRFTRTSTALPR